MGLKNRWMNLSNKTHKAQQTRRTIMVKEILLITLRSTSQQKVIGILDLSVWDLYDVKGVFLKVDLSLIYWNWWSLEFSIWFGLLNLFTGKTKTINLRVFIQVRNILFSSFEGVQIVLRKKILCNIWVKERAEFNSSSYWTQMTLWRNEQCLKKEDHYEQR